MMVFKVIAVLVRRICPWRIKLHKQ